MIRVWWLRHNDWWFSDCMITVVGVWSDQTTVCVVCNLSYECTVIWLLMTGMIRHVWRYGNVGNNDIWLTYRIISSSVMISWWCIVRVAFMMMISDHHHIVLLSTYIIAIASSLWQMVRISISTYHQNDGERMIEQLIYSYHANHHHHMMYLQRCRFAIRRIWWWMMERSMEHNRTSDTTYTSSVTISPLLHLFIISYHLTLHHISLIINIILQHLSIAYGWYHLTSRYVRHTLHLFASRSSLRIVTIFIIYSPLHTLYIYHFASSLRSYITFTYLHHFTLSHATLLSHHHFTFIIHNIALYRRYIIVIISLHSTCASRPITTYASGITACYCDLWYERLS